MFCYFCYRGAPVQSSPLSGGTQNRGGGKGRWGIGDEVGGLWGSGRWGMGVR